MITLPYPISRQIAPALFTVLGCVAFGPAGSFANGTRLPNQNAEATARGNAFVATADNPSAIYYNPAGLTQLSGLQVQAESYAIYSRYDYRPAAGGASVSNERETSFIPQIFVSYAPSDSAFTLGLGVYSPFGQASEWPDNSGFRTIATRNEITFITIAPTIAWRISDHFSIGAGLQINQVDARLRSGFAPFPSPAEFRFEGDDSSIGYNLGLLWRLNERHVVGLNYQSRSTSHFDGSVDIVPLGLSAPGSLSMQFPDVITLGYSWRPTPAWNLEVAVDRTNWELLNTPTLRSPLVTMPIPFEWKPSYYYLFGVTRYLHDGWRVSAGYCYSENSVPDATFNPAVPDMNRHFVSVGAGRSFGAFSCFVTYQHGFKASRTVSGVPANVFGESPNGRYTSSSDAVAASLRYSF